MPHAARAARPTLRLAPGRERSLLLRHPWIFSGAIEAVDGAPATGNTVDVVASDGRFLGRGAYSPSSRIRARIWSFDPATAIDAAFFAARVERAIAARAPLVDARHDACRLVHGESDGLPGVVADRYADTVVVQLTSAGAERWRDAIVDALAAATGARCVFERSDAEVRALEGLTARTGAVRGRCNDIVDIVEAGIAYRVDVAHGQKTGFYLDQRDNRALVCRHARDRRVLNAFCYTGGFTLAALVGGASRVLSIDSSAEALALARENLGRNPALDAARAYKDINLLAFKLLAPGGLLATFSCSGGVGADLFRKIVAGAARDAGVEAAVIARMSASADHPVALGFPEGEYLKGLLIRKSA